MAVHVSMLNTHVRIHSGFDHLCGLGPAGVVPGSTGVSRLKAASSWVRPTCDSAAASSTPRNPAVHAIKAVAEAAAPERPFWGGFQLSLRHRTMFLILPAEVCTV